MINPWLELSLELPYVADEDRDIITRYNQRVTKKEQEIHTNVLPEPYLGNPLAPVVILNLNPGFDFENIEEHKEPRLSKAIRDNLQHNNSDCPWYFLNPELPSLCQKWWKERLGTLISVVGREKVAKNLFVAEFFPYHSEKALPMNKLNISSQSYTFHLVKEALKREALILYFRSWKLWEDKLPALRYYKKARRVSNWQRPYVSLGNFPDCFDEITDVIGKN
jgi:hypothetical protein